MPVSAVNPPLPAAASLAIADPGGRTASAFARCWWPLGLGLVAIVSSTSIRFAQGLWQQPEFEHGPMMLAVTVWLLWRERAALLSAQSPRTSLWSAALLISGLMFYLLGVRLKAGYVEWAALVPVLAGALHLIGGWALVRRCAFSLVFLALATPMPAPVIMAATMGLKQWVSQAAEAILHIAGYPVAREGVTLRIGQYNLLMADACSGMNSLISLTAVGLLYVHLTARRSLAHMVLLLASILPVAVATNLVRVLILTLITYYLGDEAGQGFLHEFAGFVMFLIALGGLASIDFVLGKLLPHDKAVRPESENHGLA
jgi:exosortase B